MRIIVVGASGSGTTTVASMMKNLLGEEYIHIDVDDYVWKKTKIPYQEKNELDIVVKRIKTLLEKHSNVIVSGIMYPWGDELNPFFDTVILVTTKTNIRKERLISREREKYGYRMEKGGDMHDQFSRFLNWAINYDDNTNESTGDKNTRRWILSLDTIPIEIFNSGSFNELEEIVSELVKGFLEK